MSARIDLHTADENGAEALWPAVRTSHIFRDREAFHAAWAETPWHVRVDSRGRGAIVEPWREGLDIMAIRGLWAAEKDVPGVVAGLRATARAHGFTRILSPLLAEEAARPYARAGMGEYVGLVASRFEIGRGRVASPEYSAPEGTRVRKATPADLDQVCAADAQCFDAFWAYDRTRISDAMRFERVAVAESEGAIIGYTLCTVERGTGTLGRLGVIPSARGRGVGSALVADAVAYAAGSGADVVSLCTQEHNKTARGLYAALGFRELVGRLVLMLGDA